MTSASTELVLVEVADRVASVTMNRPEKRNALSIDHMRALTRELRAIGEGRAAAVVVLKGAGPAFCAGHDLAELTGQGPDFYRRVFSLCTELMETIQSIPQPVIAQVQGIATAAGCQLVAACDLAVAADDARFATSGINFGLFCATPGVPVSRNIAQKRAFEMLFTGEFIDAPTALAWGLVNRVVPQAGLDAATRALAGVILAKPRAVVAAGKDFFYRQLEASLEQAYAIAAVRITQNMLQADAQEGVGAFVEKRKPRWND